MTNPNDGLTIETLLQQYGYTSDDGVTFTPARPGSDVWRRVDGGWHCEQRAGGAGLVIGAAPWGVALCATCGLTEAEGDHIDADSQVHTEYDAEVADLVEQAQHVFVAGGRIRVPYRQTDAFADVGGLQPAKHPQCFEFVWPAERLREIFAHAIELDGDGNQVQPWRKVTDEETGIESYERIAVTA